MRPAQLDRLLALAVQAALQAGTLLQGYQGKMALADVTAKSSPVDLVSVADRASEMLLREQLAIALSGAAFVGEESPREPAGTGAEYLWVVDPLDGTSNFLAGLPIWSISLALCDADLMPHVAVVHAPPLERTWTAVRGGGARLDGRLLHVRTEPPGGGLENAMLATGFPYEVSQERSSTNIDNFVRMQRHYQKIRRLGSAAIDLAYVAEGVFDGMWELWLKEWDTAAGMLLVTEAGGLCERIDGRPFVPGAPDVLVAATPELLASMRMILNS